MLNGLPCDFSSSTRFLPGTLVDGHMNHERPGPFPPPPLQGLPHYYEPVRRRIHSDGTQSLAVHPLGTLPLATHQGSSFRARLPTFRTRAADQAHVAYMPDT